MMKRLALAGAAGTAIVAGLAYFASQPPADIFDKMQFPHGLNDSIGEEKKGQVCHQFRYVGPDGEDELIVSHNLWQHDFRTMTEEAKRAVIKADSRKDWKEHGGTLACAEPESSGLIQEAYAQPHCDDCGGSCVTRSCPAHVATGGGCLLFGATCVITYLCCGGSCPC